MELRQEIASLIREHDDDTFYPVAAYLDEADAILALPEIAVGLKLLEQKKAREAKAKLPKTPISFKEAARPFIEEAK